MYPAESQGTGASDASADERQAIVGGWWSNAPNPELSTVWWFSFRVSKGQVPLGLRQATPEETDWSTGAAGHRGQLEARRTQATGLFRPNNGEASHRFAV